jgi:hypothetical protein
MLGHQFTCPQGAAHLCLLPFAVRPPQKVGLQFTMDQFRGDVSVCPRGTPHMVR